MLSSERTVRLWAPCWIYLDFIFLKKNPQKFLWESITHIFHFSLEKNAEGSMSSETEKKKKEKNLLWLWGKNRCNIEISSLKQCVSPPKTTFCKHQDTWFAKETLHLEVAFFEIKGTDPPHTPPPPRATATGPGTCFAGYGGAGSSAHRGRSGGGGDLCHLRKD